jgi:hypothetical protein
MLDTPAPKRSMSFRVVDDGTRQEHRYPAGNGH